MVLNTCAKAFSFYLCNAICNCTVNVLKIKSIFWLTSVLTSATSRTALTGIIFIITKIDEERDVYFKWKGSFN